MAVTRAEEGWGTCGCNRAPHATQTLLNLREGESAEVLHIGATGRFHHRLLEMGFGAGRRVTKSGQAPLGDPIRFTLMGYEVTLRRSEAQLVYIDPATIEANSQKTAPLPPIEDEGEPSMQPSSPTPSAPPRRIRIALVGNPNSGKTTLFNRLCGLNAHTGNYAGVTVGSEVGHIMVDNTEVEITDLPGTYSLSAYSPEERFVQEHLTGALPDAVINVIDITNLARHLYLTIQLLEHGYHVVLALNMADEFRSGGGRLNRLRLREILGVPSVQTVGRTGEGLDELLQVALLVANGGWNEWVDPIEGYPDYLCCVADQLRDRILPIAASKGVTLHAPRALAIQLLEGDHSPDELARVLNIPVDELPMQAAQEALRCNLPEGQDAASCVAEARYAQVATVERECLYRGEPKSHQRKKLIDRALTHRIFGLPIFLALMWLMFKATFTLGDYPLGWIEQGVERLGAWVGGLLGPGIARDIIVDAVIAACGSVLVFLPHIVLLFLFISLFEESGYMARVVYMVDRIMRIFGLQGQSLIPLIMGFGCSVPSILATRTICDCNARHTTILVNPFIACSARLPVFVLLIHAIFPQQSALFLVFLYSLGVVVALGSALLFSRTLFRGVDTPFVLELPPYRVPALRSVGRQVGVRAWQYVRKLGGVILVASLIIWFLGYFPQETSRDAEFAQALHRADSLYKAGLLPEGMYAAQVDSLTRSRAALQAEESLLGRTGAYIEPLIRPLGFDWRIGVGLLSGLAAKEVVVSTFSVLFQAGNADESSLLLRERIQQAKYLSGPKKGEPLFGPATGVSLLIFIALYMPCVSAVAAIRREGGTKWAIFAALYSTGLAYLLAWIAYRLVLLV